MFLNRDRCCELNISHAPSPSFLFVHSPSKIIRMAQTVQRKQKRKQPAAMEAQDSTPPAPKRVKVAQAQTARKSTGGREPSQRQRGGGGGGGGDDDDDDDDEGGGPPRAGPSRQRKWCPFRRRNSELGLGTGRIERVSFRSLALLEQAKVPRLRKKGGTDRAPSPFAKSGSIKGARTCSCASSPLRAWYELTPPTLLRCCTVSLTASRAGARDRA